MKRVCVMQTASGVRVGVEVDVADSFWHRLRGLLGRGPLKKGEGLLLLDCDSVHTAGMGQSIDVAFLDESGRVVHAIPNMGPWRVGRGGSDAVHTLELPAGRLEETGTVPGDRLTWS